MSVVQSNVVVSIAAGAALSSAAILGDKTLAALQMPAAWTAADITFQVSPDGGTTWFDLHDDQGTETKIAAPAAGEYRQLDPAAFNSVQYIKVRSGVSATPVNQVAAAKVTLVTRKFFSIG